MSKVEGLKIRSAKFEIRNNIEIQMSKILNNVHYSQSQLKDTCFMNWDFGDFNLFLVSIFEFRILF
jgi:hypothetical protein